MSKQNVYDNEVFFEGYQQIRKKEGNANNLIEKPAIFSLAPNLKGKHVLDLGCSYGENCMEFVKMGAASVVGIDISEKMLSVAKKTQVHSKITFRHMCIEEVALLEGTYDVVFSSLAMHYIKDFTPLVRSICKLLVPGGTFLFSQEHPLTTSFSKGERWNRDENGNILCANLYDYCVEGKRKTSWLVEDVIIYHRMFSTLLNTLIENGFIIDKVLEPVPDKGIMEKYPAYQKDIHKPDFLMIKAHKA